MNNVIRLVKVSGIEDPEPFLTAVHRLTAIEDHEPRIEGVYLVEIAGRPGRKFWTWNLDKGSLEL